MPHIDSNRSRSTERFLISFESSVRRTVQRSRRRCRGTTLCASHRARGSATNSKDSRVPLRGSRGQTADIPVAAVRACESLTSAQTPPAHSELKLLILFNSLHDCFMIPFSSPQVQNRKIHIDRAPKTPKCILIINKFGQETSKKTVEL